MTNPNLEDIKAYYYVDYNTEDTCMGDIVIISKDEMSYALDAINKKGIIFYAIHNASGSSIQEWNMYNFFKKRAEKEPKYRSSLFTPKEANPPEIRFEYLEFYLLPEGVAVHIPRRKESFAPLMIGALTEPNLTMIIELCNLPLERSKECMRIRYKYDD